MKRANRSWCAKAQYPNLQAFVIGTITMPSDARHDEIIAALNDHALRFIPQGFQIIEPLCGALFFQGDE